MTPPKNIFAVARAASDEDQLTELLAWLMEQVPAVADMLIQGALPGATPPFEPTTQAAITGGQIDAWLEGRDAVAGIECKVDAPFGFKQRERYLEALIERAAVPNRALITLTKLSAQWPPEMIVRAREHRVELLSMTWGGLRRDLLQLAKAETLSMQECQLVEQFAEMLFKTGLGRADVLRGADLSLDAGSPVSGHGGVHDMFSHCLDVLAEQKGLLRHGNSESQTREDGLPYWYGLRSGGFVDAQWAVGFDYVGGRLGLIVGLRGVQQPPVPEGWQPHRASRGGASYGWVSTPVPSDVANALFSDQVQIVCDLMEIPIRTWQASGVAPRVDARPARRPTLPGRVAH